MQVTGRIHAKRVAGRSAGRVVPLRAVDGWRTPTGTYERWFKPALDRLVGVAASIITLPLVLVISVMIVSQMGGPAIFRQRRVGRYGREFTVYKFRTMQHDRRTTDGPAIQVDRRVTHKSESDPRHTPLGRRLRRWSLDEIPQFWNVARGDMSLVGPRPELPSVVAAYEPWQHGRHSVRPGLTGLWQISARGVIPMHEATELDIAYAENVTFRDDLRITLATPAAAFGSNHGH